MATVSLAWTDDRGDQQLELQSGTYIIGRSPKSQIVIAHKGISSRHAQIRVEDQLVALKDLGSSTGTFFNAKPLEPNSEVELLTGDRFTLGRILFSLGKQSETPRNTPELLQDEPAGETEQLLKQIKNHFDQSQMNQSSNEELLSQIKRQLVQYQILQKITQVLGQIHDINSMLKIALKLVGEELGADRGFIILYDSAIHKMNSMVTWHYDLSCATTKHEYTFSRTLAVEALRKGSILIVDDALEDPKFQSSHSILSSSIRSVICIPLFRGQDILGVIYLDNLNVKGQFKEVHEDFLRTFARQASMALHNAKLYTQAITDDLSGLFLRKYMDRRIREELARVQRHSGFFSILMIDIDFFKQVNDTYGHQAGDEVISEIARRLQQSAREMDVVGRYGGEEFMMLLPETTAKGAFILAERIRQTVSQATFQSEGRTFSITASVGVCSSKDCETLNEQSIVANADKALYAAKHQGRNRSVIWTPDNEVAAKPQ